MNDQLKLSTGFKIAVIALITVGVGIFIYGFVSDPDRTWANYLLNNYYFLSLALGAAFFLAIQHVTHAGWSAAFKRVAEAVMLYIPVAALFFLLIFFGMKSLYEWTNTDVIANDPLIAHKTPYLNIPFFFIRMVVFFALWTLMIWLIRKASLKEDNFVGQEWYKKREHYSRILIFIMLGTISLATIDWIKSIEAHWFSTIFALKNFVAAFYHGTTIIILVVFILHSRGHFKFLNPWHLHDFTRYIFMLAIIWGYFWFAQFMLIWFGNIPEETVYFVGRFENGFKPLFFIEILVNWFIPFAVLLPTRTSRSKIVITLVILCLIPGQYIDLFNQIMPGTLGELKFGLIEVGAFLGYAGLFAGVIGYTLTRAPLVPRNHPFLEESLEHQF